MLSPARVLLFTVIVAAALAAGVELAAAQSSLGIGTAEPSFSISGPFGGILAEINRHQQAFYRALTEALRAMRADPWKLVPLVGLSFAYGIFHAAGPGHGKAVISSYMIANETALKRGVAISFLSALLQGLVAIALVALAWLALRGTSVSLSSATLAMEKASFAMIALFGLWLLYRKIRAPWRQPVPEALFSAPAGGGRTGLSFRADACDERHAADANGICAACGNTHMPDPATLGARDFSLREAWSAILAVGLRPCSGALLVMSFSLLNGLYVGGALSVAAMSLGTAITVSLLAVLAVAAKDVALRLAGPGSKGAARVRSIIEIGGALFVLLMGLTLLAASFQS